MDEIKGVYADVSKLEKPVEVAPCTGNVLCLDTTQEQKPEKMGCR